MARERRSGVVRPSLFWFLLLDGGIVILSKLALSKPSYVKAKEMSGNALPPARCSKRCWGRRPSSTPSRQSRRAAWPGDGGCRHAVGGCRHWSWDSPRCGPCARARRSHNAPASARRPLPRYVWRATGEGHAVRWRDRTVRGAVTVGLTGAAVVVALLAPAGA